MKNKINTKTAIPLIISITLIIGIWIGSTFSNSNSHSFSASDSKKLSQILGLIQQKYVEPINTDSIIEKSLPDIIAQLDPHSFYIPAKDLQNTNDDLNGSFSGVGISFRIINDTITILEVIPGGPCEKMGILAGDRIISVDKQNVAGISITNEKVMSLLKGPKDTKVKLGIKRSNSSKPYTFEITRGNIPVNSINAAYIISPEIGYIKVDKFTDKTYQEFYQALNKLSKDGASKFIIDLRGNGGGYMSAALNMANEFLPANKIIVKTKTRTDESPSISHNKGKYTNTEVVILIDEFSASASEILAGALQDHDRGLIIGRRSFGKGLIQNQFELPDKSALRLTVGRYYTPSGRCIQKDYTLGDKKYDYDLIDRINHGESVNADSIKLNTNQKYNTSNGRIVYGGGGIMPDIFVPNDTSEISKYYLALNNAGMFQQFSFYYCDKHRKALNECKNVYKILNFLPTDNELLNLFTSFAIENKINYTQSDLNKSKNLILNITKALIARDAIGTQAYYEVFNQYDPTVQSAISHIKKGDSKFPIKVNYKR